ncbi:hypothetical protein cypCar_00044006 [Cyprinus carpio]|nr:hypothetical protein cypCar_00044006 [Cyprinus carpio]
MQSVVLIQVLLNGTFHEDRRFRVREVLNISLKNSNPPVYPFSHDLKDFIHERKRDRARISRPLGTSEAPLAGKTLEEPRLVKRVAAGYSENIRLSRSFVSTSRECRSRKSSSSTMSQWKQIQQLDIKFLEQVDYFYDDNFPMELRQVLANWIESQDWETASNHESMATVLFNNFLIQLERQCSQEQNFLHRHNLKRIFHQIQVKYKTNPLHMAAVICNCLREERRILSTASMQEQGPLEKSMQNSATLEKLKVLDNKVAVIRSSVQMLDQGVKYLEDMQDDFDFRYKTLQLRDPVERNSLTMKQEVTTLQEILNRLDFKRKEILSKIADVIKEIDTLISSQLNPELKEWKRRQQIACIGGPVLIGLDQLQNWFTLTAQSLFQIKRQLDKLGELILKVTYESDPIPLQRPQMEEQVKYLIYHLIKSSFVVEKQPCMPTHPQKPLIIKTQVQFTTKVRLLVKLPEVDYQLKVKTTFDKDLPPGKVNRQFFILTNNTKVMDVEESTGCLSVEFRHLSLTTVVTMNCC